MKTYTKNAVEDKALNKFAEMLIEKIENAQSDWSKPWFVKGAGIMPQNIHGRAYSGSNSLMLLIHCERSGYKIPIFATFDSIKKLNEEGVKREEEICVKKGEASFPVMLTTWVYIHKETKKKIKASVYQNLSPEEKEQYKAYPRESVYNVFNVAAQTNIKEVRPDLYKKFEDKVNPDEQKNFNDDSFHLPELDSMIKEQRWICPINLKYGDEAYYSITGKQITVPEPKQFKCNERFYGTLLHEMAHSTGAEDQLNRLKPATFGSKVYAREELVAELTSALECNLHGMDKHIKEDSIPYLKNWLDNLKENAVFIKEVLKDVKLASLVIEKHLEAEKEQKATA